MIPFLIYALIITGLIYYNYCFKLFRDEHLSKRILSFTFILKIVAVPAFYLFFKYSYGGITKLDAGKFYADAVAINHIAFDNFSEYLKMLVGLQDDSPGSYFFKHGIDTTNNWDNGAVKDFLYNDNRIVIRIHSLIHFIAFGSYFVHALFSCFFSFIGLFFIYKTFKEFFDKRELVFFILICFFPTLWLYTGGLLKEGITLLFLGLLLYSLKHFIAGSRKPDSIVALIFLFFVSLLLKPYILFFAAVFYSLFFIIIKTRIKHKAIVFIGLILIIAVITNQAAALIKGRSLVEAAQKREREFMDLSTGGIFLLDSIKFVRVPYDTNLVKRVNNRPEFYTIKQGVSYTYWEHSHQKDTLYCKNNLDAITQYSLVYSLPKAGSMVNVVRGSSNLFIIGLRSLYYTTLYPLFFNAKGLMQKFASLENLLLVFSFLISLIGIILNKTIKLPGLAFLFYAICILILIGFTTPNSGAIMRYRSPVAIFIIMSALYFWPTVKLIMRKKPD